MKFTPEHFFDGSEGMSLEFFADEGGVFTQKPPTRGFYFNLATGTVGLAGREGGLIDLGRVHRKDLPFPFFSTHISRNAGRADVWGAENPVSVFRKASRIRRRVGGGGRLGDGELVDLLRFTYEVRRMTMLDLSKLASGYVYDGHFWLAGAGTIKVFGLLPQKMDFGHFSRNQGVSIFRVRTEASAGTWGGDYGEGGGAERPVFTVDKLNGLLIGRGGEAVGHGLPRSKAGGRGWFTNWEGMAGTRLDGREFPVGQGGGLRFPHSGVFVNLKKINVAEQKLAILETLSSLRFLEGPRRRGVLRASGSIFDRNRSFYLCIGTRGVAVENVQGSDWGRCRQAEVAKLGLFVKDIGLSDQAGQILKTGKGNFPKKRREDRLLE